MIHRLTVCPCNTTRLLLRSTSTSSSELAVISSWPSVRQTANLRSLRLIIEPVRWMDRWKWQEIKWHRGGTAEFARMMRRFVASIAKSAITVRFGPKKYQRSQIWTYAICSHEDSLGPFFWAGFQATETRSEMCHSADVSRRATLRRFHLHPQSSRRSTTRCN
jgi:hypothetical protein